MCKHFWQADQIMSLEINNTRHGNITSGLFVTLEMEGQVQYTALCDTCSSTLCAFHSFQTIQYINN